MDKRLRDDFLKGKCILSEKPGILVPDINFGRAVDVQD